MGTLHHFNLHALAQLHGLQHFVETGMAQGDSLALAAGVPAFKTLHSVEIVPELVTAARARFKGDGRVQVWEGDSVTCLAMVLRDFPPEPCLFWLDAHFPGAHSGADYAAEPDVKKRLPLADEELALCRFRPAIDMVLS